MLKGIRKNCLILKKKKGQNNLMIKQESFEPRFKKVEMKEKDLKNNLKKKKQKRNNLSKP